MTNTGTVRTKQELLNLFADNTVGAIGERDLRDFVESIYDEVGGGGGNTDEIVKVSSDDSAANYLENKIVAGTNVTIATLNPGGNETFEISATGGSSSDELAKVSSDDTTANYLESKIVAGTNITVTTLNPGGNETFEISAAGGGGSGGTVQGTDGNTYNIRATNEGATAGNARGEYSIDLQTFRSAATMVASAGGGIILGGFNNTVSALYSAILTGGSNTITGANFAGYYSVILTGFSNSIITGQNSLIGCGTSNTIGDATEYTGYSSFCTGTGNTVAQDYSAWIAGSSNNMDGSSFANYNVGLGGRANYSTGVSGCVMSGRSGHVEDCNYSQVWSSYSYAYDQDRLHMEGGFSTIRQTLSSGNNNHVEGGYHDITGRPSSCHFEGGHHELGNTNSLAFLHMQGSSGLGNLYAEHVHGGGSISTNGDAQQSVVVARRQTTDATQLELFLGNPGNSRRIDISTDTTWAFSILVTARRTDADDESLGYEAKGVIDNNAGTTALVGSITDTILGDDSSGTWDVTVDADDTNDALRIRVTGEAAKTINWVARIEMVQTIG